MTRSSSFLSVFSRYLEGVGGLVKSRAVSQKCTLPYFVCVPSDVTSQCGATQQQMCGSGCGRADERIDEKKRDKQKEERREKK